MALSIPDATKNSILDNLGDTLIDSSGYAQFESTGDTQLARIQLNSTGWDASAAGSKALNTAGELQNTNATAGTISNLKFYTTNGTERLDFSVSTQTTTNYCNLSTTSLGAGDTIEITSCSLNMGSN